MFKKHILTATLCSAFLLAACSGGNGGASSNAGASAASSAGLDVSKTYIVATDASYPPMEYMDNDHVVGFSHDILDAAAKSQNVKLEFVNTPFEGLFANVDKGDSDVGLASITINDERKQQLDFSDPYFAATQMIITENKNSNAVKSFADLKNRTASVQAATSGDLILQKLQGKDSTKIKRFETMPLAFKELETGGVLCEAAPRCQVKRGGGPVVYPRALRLCVQKRAQRRLARSHQQRACSNQIRRHIRQNPHPMVWRAV